MTELGSTDSFQHFVIQVIRAVSNGCRAEEGVVAEWYKALQSRENINGYQKNQKIVQL